VTGGPDLSLMEVNEASCIIQEAAHEDANIIFGAVVDPALTGRVKITVIATGFDRKTSTRHVPAAATTTPVDLTRYQEQAQRVYAAAGGGAPLLVESAPLVAPAPIARRPSIEIPPRAAESHTQRRLDDQQDGDFSSPLDVPAFLRRT
jgi:cell division protein FtsZ